MATGTTYDFNETRDQIIKDALSKIGAIGPDQTPSGVQTNNAVRALNRIVKSIDPEALHLWKVAERTATTTAGTQTFTPAADVMSIDEPMNYKRSGQNGRSPIRQISRDDWMNIADRTVRGVPSVFYVSETLSGITVSLWPIPDASSDTVTYSAVVRSFDYDTAANTSDFTQEWQMCLVYGLAADLAFDYGQPQLAQQLRSVFMEEKGRLLESGTENGNVQLVAWGNYMGDW